MINYPSFKTGMTIGITAPSSGVPTELHAVLDSSIRRLEERSFHIVCGETAFTQEKAKSASAKKRAAEFNRMMSDDQIQAIIPPWGGELLIEILEHVDFEKMKNKWVLGYSDTSVLLLAITLTTGIATAHGPNLVDLRGEYWDETTGAWLDVLSTERGASILQYSSTKYQEKWQHDNPTPCLFHLTEPTHWKVISHTKAKVQGRLLGGCVDVIRHLIGTPYGDVGKFRKAFIDGEPILWFFENCELVTTDLRRSLVQMKLAGWFEGCSGILFGRSSANQPVQGYTVEDVYQELADELQVPVIYDMDCGHVPPQITFINGAYAEVEVAQGKGFVKQYFR
ncbi:S66 family peptidase [Laceyella sacchari]|uniref:LD-carboxypeptidase n=1 Tax=Laceyella sacchari TaxID=37482 RepID=A0ABY5U5V4_LACSH|nr:S66 peptidase family protein [Laceyella sacchari]UWE05022.1 LD-carboxypeptidase [Laceyella sacchari]